MSSITSRIGDRVMPCPERQNAPASPKPGRGASYPLARLVEDHERFRRYVQRWVDNPDDAREIVHDLCVKLLEGTGGPDGHASTDAWLRRALRNQVIDRYRRAASRRRMLTSFAEELDSAPIGNVEPMAGVCSCPAGQLQGLPAPYGDVIRRADLLGEPRARVAADLGISASHLAVRLHRARRALRQLVAAHCGTCCADGVLDCDCASTTTASGAIRHQPTTSVEPPGADCRAQRV
jgi:RNA polymerase sigma-70 factor (ECF subfamily)